MQVELAGVLASLLSRMSPAAGSVDFSGEVSPVGEFQQILERLETVIETQGQGQLPLPSREWQKWMDQLKAALGGRREAVLDDLGALSTQVKVWLQQVGDTTRFMGTAAGEWPPQAEVGMRRPRTELQDASGDAAVVLTSQAVGLPTMQLTDSAEPSAQGVVTMDLPEKGREIVGTMAAVVMPLTEADAGSRTDEGVAPITKSTATERPAETELSRNAQGQVEIPFRESPLPPEDRSLSPESGGDIPFLHSSLPSVQPAHQENLFPRTVLSFTLNQPFNQPEWADELGDRLLWLHDKSVQVAQLRIHPEHLGPVEVRVRIHDDQTSIQFSSPHAVVREAIEAALPRLRELFATQQLQLAQVEVGQQFADGQSPSRGRHSQEQTHPSLAAGAGAADSREEERRRLPLRGNHLLSLYA